MHSKTKEYERPVDERNNSVQDCKIWWLESDSLELHTKFDIKKKVLGLLLW